MVSLKSCSRESKVMINWWKIINNGIDHNSLIGLIIDWDVSKLMKKIALRIKWHRRLLEFDGGLLIMLELGVIYNIIFEKN